MKKSHTQPYQKGKMSEEYTTMRCFDVVVWCDTEDMQRLLNTPKFMAKMPPSDGRKDQYRVDQVIKWFNECLADGFLLEHERPARGHYHGADEYYLRWQMGAK